MKDKKNNVGLGFHVLVKQEKEFLIAHCLELDIVATGNTLEQVQDDMLSLISAQVSYAFANDNLLNLFRPAPLDVWEEFFSCKEEMIEKIHQIKPPPERRLSRNVFIPPTVATSTCLSPSVCYG